MKPAQEKKAVIKNGRNKQKKIIQRKGKTKPNG